MTITSIDIYRYSIPMEPFTIASGTLDHAANVLIVIETSTGLRGYGECCPFPSIVGETQETALALARQWAPLWINKDPLDIDGRLGELHAFCRNNPTIKSAFDMALYDIAAQAQGVPLYRFLGGQIRPVRTDITIGIASLDKMCADAARRTNAGAREIKVKVGADPRQDVEKIRQLRATIGPDVGIRIDANQGWSFKDAVWALQAMESSSVQFCEQPMHAVDDHFLPALRELTTIPIMADESCYDSVDARQLIDRQSCDYINIKLAKTGGIREALRLHQVAERHGISCMVGGMIESRLAITANLHFVYASKQVVFYDLDGPLLDLKADPVLGGVRYDGLDLSVAEEPGLGATVDPSFLKECEHWRIS